MARKKQCKECESKKGKFSKCRTCNCYLCEDCGMSHNWMGLIDTICKSCFEEWDGRKNYNQCKYCKGFFNWTVYGDDKLDRCEWCFSSSDEDE